MAVREIRIWPDPALKQVAETVLAVDDGVRALIDDLFETMYKANGVGLAATQIAVPRRVVVIDLDPNHEADAAAEIMQELRGWGFEAPMALVNPKIITAAGQIVWEEGCLSVPGVTEPVKRRERVTVDALDRHGQAFTVQATGLFAVALQHEIDHLDGRVFVEYLSKLKRDVIRRKMQRIKEEGEAAGETDVAL